MKAYDRRCVEYKRSELEQKQAQNNFSAQLIFYAILTFIGIFVSSIFILKIIFAILTVMLGYILIAFYK